MKKLFLLLATFAATISNVNADDFARGADVSWTSEMEACNIKFYNTQGDARECMALFKEIGATAIRLRVWVNPQYGYNNAADVLAKAKRVKAQGLDLMIDFHYSDTWADPSHQTMPAAWAKCTVEQLCDSITAHTTSVLTLLKNNDINVKWVQIGNETTNGMLWTKGGYFANGDNGSDYAQGRANYAKFINTGVKAAKSVFPEIKTIVHVDRAASEVPVWSLDVLKSNGGDWDITGLSFYPTANTWASEEADCAANVKKIIARYGKPVILVETGFPRTDSRMEAYLTKLRTDLEAIEGCQGIFYWEPEDYNDWNNGYKLGAFTSEGKPSAGLIKLLQPSTTGIGSVETDKKQGSTVKYSVNGLPVDSSYKGIVIADGRKHISK